MRGEVFRCIYGRVSSFRLNLRNRRAPISLRDPVRRSLFDKGGAEWHENVEGADWYIFLSDLM